MQSFVIDNMIEDESDDSSEDATFYLEQLERLENKRLYTSKRSKIGNSKKRVEISEDDENSDSEDESERRPLPTNATKEKTSGTKRMTKTHDVAPSKKRTKKKNKMQQMKERKRNNRINANRNDYGNEGFLLMVCYYLGCYIRFRKPPKPGVNQKMRVEEIGIGERVLIKREDVEEEIKHIVIPEDATNYKRAKRTILATMIDNKLLDLLKNEFGFLFEESVKKKPLNDFMPERRVLERIELSCVFEKKAIIDEGVEFYENAKLYGENVEEFCLVKEEVEECLLRDVVPRAKALENSEIVSRQLLSASGESESLLCSI